MKTVGLIWWMSRESTVEYYRMMNEMVKEKLWWLHSAELLLYSVDFHAIEKLQHAWDRANLTKEMIRIATLLEAGGAEWIMICTNTMHKMAESVSKSIQIPLIHIADATAKEIVDTGIQRIWLLWTKFTMEQDFYAGRLRDRFDLDVIIPDKKGRDDVHRIIYDELCCGRILPESKEIYKDIISQMIDEWAEGIILWCTEIMLLVGKEDSSVPVFDTTSLHAKAGVDFMIWK